MALSDLLAPYGMSDDDYLELLAELLRSEPRFDSAVLTTQESDLLARWSGLEGLEAPSGEAGRMWVGQVTANVAESLNRSLSVSEVSERLGISGSRVRHRVNERALYAFKIGNQLRFPVWQFRHNIPLPGLARVIGALDPALHPLEVAGFMTTPDDSLEIGQEASTPLDWLATGGDPVAVADLAALIGVGW